MHEIAWTPAIVVLVIGGIAGVILARLQGGSDRDTAARAADLEDLRRQKERLLRALRDLQDLSRGDVDGERAELELRAADVMRRLEQAEAVDRKAARKAAVAEARKQGKVAAGGLSAEVKGMLKGAAVVAFVALCFFMLTRSTSERTEGMGMTGGQPGMTTAGGQGPDLSPGTRARLEAARTGVAAAPGSLDAQIELGFALIEAQGWMEAGSVAGTILDQAPSNPDGLVILGVVQLKRSKPGEAAEAFRRALESDPNHLAALSYSGLVALEVGDVEAARAAWTRARAFAEGADLQTLDGLLAMLDQRAPPAAAAAGARVISGTIRLADGASPPEGGVLFVIARREGVDSGAPVATRRLLSGSLPATFTIGQGDVMMGGPFPDAVTLSARLDADGNAGTKGEGDLVGTAGVVQAGADGVEILLAPR